MLKRDVSLRLELGHCTLMGEFPKASEVTFDIFLMEACTGNVNSMLDLRLTISKEEGKASVWRKKSYKSHRAESWSSTIAHED